MDRTVARAALLTTPSSSTADLRPRRSAAHRHVLARALALAVAAVTVGAIAPAATAATPSPSAAAESTDHGGLGGTGTVAAAGTALPGVTANSFVLADLGSGAILAARRAHAAVAPASTLKMLTAIVTMRRLDPAETVIADAGDAVAHGSVAGLIPARSYTVAQLWDALMLASGNDAALALARTYPGRQRALVADMNKEAARIGAADTHALTPTGLDTAGQVTSAYDLVLIARDGLSQARFARTVAQRTASLPGAEGEGAKLVNRNELLGTYRGAIGVKTGDTPQAGYNLVAAARRHGRTLVVALTSSTKPVFTQAAALLDWGFATPAKSAGVAALTKAAAAPAVTGRAAAGSSDTASGNGGAASSAPSSTTGSGSGSATAGSTGGTAAGSGSSSEASQPPAAASSGSGLGFATVGLVLLGLLLLVVLLVPVSLRPADGSEPRRGPRRARPNMGRRSDRPSSPVGARPSGRDQPPA